MTDRTLEAAQDYEFAQSDFEGAIEYILFRDKPRKSLSLDEMRKGITWEIKYGKDDESGSR